MSQPSTDTIAAIATPPGRGGIGIVRVSGKLALDIAEKITAIKPKPRYAHYSNFNDADGIVIDIGIIIYFPAPHSFTGEDIIEFQGHGGQVVMDSLLQRILQLGARLATPGEFSQRAFLNDKIDLTQAEAIADLIDSSSQQAARCAIRSLQGEFSKRIDHFLEKLINLRIYIEAAIDFPDEEIDFLSDGKVEWDLMQLLNELKLLIAETKQGTILREGVTVVIAGHPNAGKSTLLNQLSGREAAIVTDIPGTTRDVMREYILINGVPLHIIDTAGLRDSDDPIEQEGIRRARHEIDNADRVLVIIDGQQLKNINIKQYIQSQFNSAIPVTIIINKIDLLGTKVHRGFLEGYDCLYISAKQALGIDLLRQYLREQFGFSQTNEGGFIARRRHLQALENALHSIKQGAEQLSIHHAGELVAEDLRAAQQYLCEITGEFTSDDLLGKIFSEFCIGK